MDIQKLIDDYATWLKQEITFEKVGEYYEITTPYLDKDHPKILYVNNAFTRMSGYKAEEIINKTPRILQGEKTDREVLKRLKECLSQEEYFEGKAINYTKEGNEYWVEWNISPVYDENKKLIAFISMQKDISVSQKLLNQIKLFQTAIDQNDDSIALFSPKGDYIYVNRAFINILKWNYLRRFFD